MRGRSLRFSRMLSPRVVHCAVGFGCGVGVSATYNGVLLIFVVARRIIIIRFTEVIGPLGCCERVDGESYRVVFVTNGGQIPSAKYPWFVSTLRVVFSRLCRFLLFLFSAPAASPLSDVLI